MPTRVDYYISGVADWTDIGTPSDYYGGQSFTTSEAYNLYSVRVKLQKTTTEDATVKIYATSGGLPTGAALASKTIATAGIPSSVDWVEFIFDSPPSLSNGVMYFIEVSSSGADLRFYDDHLTGSYSGGQRWIHPSNAEGWSNSYPNDDHSFETYKSAAVNHWLLMGV